MVDYLRYGLLYFVNSQVSIAEHILLEMPNIPMERYLEAQRLAVLITTPRINVRGPVV